MSARLYILVFITAITCSFSYSQQLGQYTFYQSNWQVFNPAAINYVKFIAPGQTNSISGSYRKQWVGFEDSPTSYNLKWEKIPNLKSSYGIMDKSPMKYGLYLNHNQTGAISTTDIFANYAYFIRFGDGASISFGLNAGVFQYRLDNDEIHFEHTGDILNAGQNQWHLDFALGAFLLVPEKFYMGFSIPQTFDFNLSGTSPEGFEGERVPHYYLMYGHFIKPGGRDSDFMLEPSIWLRYLQNIEYGTIREGFPISADVNLRGFYKNIWAGLGAGTFKTAHVDFGYLLKKNNFSSEQQNFDSIFSIGLAYGFPFGWNGLDLGSSLELTLAYSWD